MPSTTKDLIKILESKVQDLDVKFALSDHSNGSFICTATDIKSLIGILEGNDQDATVEYVVAETNGTVVCMDVGESANSLVSALRTIGGKI